LDKQKRICTHGYLFECTAKTIAQLECLVERDPFHVFFRGQIARVHNKFVVAVLPSQSHQAVHIFRCVFEDLHEEVDVERREKRTRCFKMNPFRTQGNPVRNKEIQADGRDEGATTSFMNLAVDAVHHLTFNLAYLSRVS
jgi:hypothetical protein